MTEEQCFWKFVQLRWGSQDTVPCRKCGTVDRPYARVDRGQLRCRHCDHHFSPLSWTVFADRKMSFKKMLLAVCLFTASAKGIPALFLSRVLDVQAKTASVFVGKLRECLLLQADNDILQGVVEADGGHFCGKPRKGRVRFKTTAGDIEAKLTAKLNGEKAPRRKPRSKAEARNWARRQLRRIVMVVRETAMPGSGASKTRIAIGYAENAKVAEAVMREMVKPGSVLMTDENAAYIPLAAFYDHKSVQHSVEFSTDDGINENQAESFFSRMRRAEYGTYHGFRPKYLHDYAQEFAWREDTRRMTENEKLVDLSSRIFGNGLSRWWRGYWQGFHRPGEYKLYG